VLIALLLVPVLVGAGLWITMEQVLPRYRPSLQAGEKYGIDVSNHQGDINWQRVASGGDVSFAYIKATEGNDFLDRSFSTNWSKAATAGVSRGAYHFFTLCSPGAEQAKNFLSVLPPDPTALPPAVDLEFSNCPQRPDNATVQRELHAFIDTVEHAVRRPVVVYTVPAFEKVYPIDPSLQRERWQRKLFRRPAADSWTVWQVSDRARVAGIHGPVDLDVQRTAVGR
jgi:lysozyme